MRQLPLISRRRTHIAIMRKSWGLLEKIRSGEKTIESRWSLHRISPWNEIEKGDTIYFKDSGQPVTLSAVADKVAQFEELTPVKVGEILHQYGQKDGLDVGELDQYYEQFKNKRYCILIFLKDIRKIEPFYLNKKGFGTMSSWITVDDIERVKIVKTAEFKQASLLRK